VRPRPLPDQFPDAHLSLSLLAESRVFTSL
jgi:hypothetical protein